MMLDIFLAICFLACGFYLYALSQWTQETHRDRAGRRAMEREGGAPASAVHAEDCGGHAGGQEHGNAKSHHAAVGRTDALHGRGAGWKEGERMAYARIAASMRMR
jgi:hypothetical protein